MKITIGPNYIQRQHPIYADEVLEIWCMSCGIGPIVFRIGSTNRFEFHCCICGQTTLWEDKTGGIEWD